MCYFIYTELLPLTPTVTGALSLAWSDCADVVSEPGLCFSLAGRMPCTQLPHFLLYSKAQAFLKAAALCWGEEGG